MVICIKTWLCDIELNTNGILFHIFIIFSKEYIHHFAHFTFIKNKIFIKIETILKTFQLTIPVENKQEKWNIVNVMR